MRRRGRVGHPEASCCTCTAPMEEVVSTLHRAAMAMPRWYEQVGQPAQAKLPARSAPTDPGAAWHCLRFKRPVVVLQQDRQAGEVGPA
jgi:hypothetical protein